MGLEQGGLPGWYEVSWGGCKVGFASGIKARLGHIISSC